MSYKKQVIKLKVCVIGQPKSGKSSFIQKVIGQNHDAESDTSEYEVTMFCAEAKHYFLEVQLWDCSSQHLSFHQYLRQAYFRNSSASLLIFDVNDPKWQDHAHNWISQAYENQCYLVYAIGTKQDLTEEPSLYKQQSLEESLMTKSQRSWSADIQAEITEFFNKYDVTVILQSSKETLKVEIRQLFVRMHDQYMIISRASLSRGLQITLLEDVQQIQTTTVFLEKNQEK